MLHYISPVYKILLKQKYSSIRNKTKRYYMIKDYYWWTDEHYFHVVAGEGSSRLNRFLFFLVV